MIIFGELNKHCVPDDKIIQCILELYTLTNYDKDKSDEYKIDYFKKYLQKQDYESLRLCINELIDILKFKYFGEHKMWNTPKNINNHAVVNEIFDKVIIRYGL